jgi:pimeloyl-ACP methyl ester carboxylesterase
MHIGTSAWLSLMLLIVPLTSALAEPAPTAATHLIDVDGHKIAFHVTPGRGPTIVLDAGGGADSSYWDSFVPELAKRTGSKIITYDRSGLGASDDVSGPWNVHNATRDLAVGLEKLHATERVILVSHSLAGEIATYLVGQHPKWFLGAVMVDANVPDFYTDAAIARAEAMYAPIIAATKAAPPSKAGRQLLALSESFVETSREFHRAKWPASVPVIVIVAEKTPFNDPADAQWWKDSHAQFAKRAPNRRLVNAAGSSHDVAHDRPDVILTAISDIAAGLPRR